MKRIKSLFLSILFLVPLAAQADVRVTPASFPDENFRNWILEEYADEDGIISTWKIQNNITSINVTDKNIKSLKGIEYFTALTSLSCGDNLLTSLDVSKNKKLRSLYCGSNQLTELDVSSNTELTLLGCYRNQLTSLNVSNNTKLEYLACFGNKIEGTSMDNLINSLSWTEEDKVVVISEDYSVENNYNICTYSQVRAIKAKGWTPECALVLGYPITFVSGEYYKGDILDINNEIPDENFRTFLLEQDYGADGFITAYEVEYMRKLKVSHRGIKSLEGIDFFLYLEELDCSYNNLTELNISENEYLRKLDCNNNELTYLNVANIFFGKNYATLAELDCMSNLLTSLDVSRNTALTMLNCMDNPLTSLDVSRNTALTMLMCSGSGLTSLDVSNNTALTTLWCGGNLTSLDVSKNIALTELSCAGNSSLTNLDISKNTALTTLYCNNNSSLTNLDVSNNKELRVLNCSYNQLTNLDVSNNKALERLTCGNNQLTNLDLSNNTALRTLDTSDYIADGYNYYTNNLTNLDISKNTALYYLSCYGNQLTELDVSKNIALTYLYCHDNQLTSLDVSNNTGLLELQCQNNQLTALDVTKNTRLVWLYCFDNQLITLDMTAENTRLTVLYCYRNMIKGTAMDAFIGSLPVTTSGSLRIYDNESAGDEGNVCTKTHVAAAKEKGWTPYYYYTGKWQAYEGSDDDDTGITLPNMGMNDRNAPAYNLSGQRTTDYQQGKKGIYIVGGKKIVVK